LRASRRAAREHLSSAEERATAMKDFKLTIHAKAGTEGKLFGSIGTSDIAEACNRAGFKIERSEVRLPNGPLRTLGEHTVSLHLHADIDVPLQVTIVPEE
jgi:large subunit ribosomal protein L9